MKLIRSLVPYAQIFINGEPIPLYLYLASLLRIPTSEISSQEQEDPTAPESPTSSEASPLPNANAWVRMIIQIWERLVEQYTVPQRNEVFGRICSIFGIRMEYASGDLTLTYMESFPSLQDWWRTDMYVWPTATFPVFNGSVNRIRVQAPSTPGKYMFVKNEDDLSRITIKVENMSTNDMKPVMLELPLPQSPQPSPKRSPKRSLQQSPRQSPKRSPQQSPQRNRRDRSPIRTRSKRSVC